jgi:very-short-patch-repair endonuclease
MAGPALSTVFRLAEPHGGCVSAAMLAKAGIGEDHVRSLVRRGALVRVVRGVYAIAADHISHAQLCQAALLVPRRGAHLCARSAAENYRLLPAREGSVCVGRVAGRFDAPKVLRTAIAIRETGRPGAIRVLTVLERAAIWEVVNGNAVEPPHRALRRLAVSEDAALLPRAWREANFRGLLLEAALEAEVARGEGGAQRLADLLAEQPPKPVDAAFRSRMEMRLYEAMRRRGLPEPRVNGLTQVGDRFVEFDFLFADGQLVVEADGPHHRLPSRAAEDAERDSYVRARGLEVLRFDDDEIDRGADACAITIEQTLSERRRDSAA